MRVNDIYLLKNQTKIAFRHQKNQHAKRTRAKNPEKVLNNFFFAYETLCHIICSIQPIVFTGTRGNCIQNNKDESITFSGRNHTSKEPAVGVYFRVQTIADPGPGATVVLYADPRHVDGPCVSDAVPNFPVDVNFPL